MNREFKLKYDELRDNDPTKPRVSLETLDNQFYDGNQGRNLCLVFLNSKRFFLNYSYLLAGEFDTDGDRNLIILTFTSHRVIIEGYMLESIFLSLVDHLPKKISEVEERYISASETVAPKILKITIVERT